MPTCKGLALQERAVPWPVTHARLDAARAMGLAAASAYTRSMQALQQQRDEAARHASLPNPAPATGR